MSTAPRLLLVEDNPADARLLLELFRDAGFALGSLGHAQRLSEAVALLGSSAFDAVLLDLTLPDSAGPETVLKVHEAHPEVPLIVLTGLDDEPTALQAMQLGAQDYLVKGSFTDRDVVRAVRYAIERTRAERVQRELAREQAARVQLERSARRLELLAEVSRLLGSDWNYEPVLAKVTALAVPALCDHCYIDLRDIGGHLRRVAAADPGGPVSDLRAHSAAHPATPPGPVASTHRLIPLVGHGRVLGTMAFVCDDADRWRQPSLTTLADEIAARVAAAVDHGRLYRAREEVLAIVSHDLRNPLNVVGLTTSRLLRDPGLPEERRLKAYRQISRSVDRMSGLITDLLDMVRIDAGSLTLAATLCEPAELVDETCEHHRPVSEERRIVLVGTAVGELPRVALDRNRILQVLSNLVGNALKFTPEGGRVGVSATREADAVRFTVTDSGPGIAPEILDRVFDRFWQARSDGATGAGLGLSIAKGLVEAHGGRIWAESVPGAGSSFHFRVPLAGPALLTMSSEALGGSRAAHV